MLAHAQALKTVLEQECVTFIGDPDENCPVPYTFIWGMDGGKDSRVLSRHVPALDMAFNVSCVAATGNNALSLAERITDRMTSAALFVAGWRTFPISERDISVNGPLTQRGVFEDETNRYPSLVVISARLRAVKERAHP